MSLIFSICIFIIAYFLGVKYRVLPFYFVQETFSIGLFEGNSPLSLIESKKIVNPIIKQTNVSSFPCRFVADPFLYNYNSKWFIFYEAMDMKTQRGRICCSYSSDLQNWHYKGIAIAENFHLSYPYIFEYNGKIFMIPETSRKFEVRLYECCNFPDKWEFKHVLLRGRYTDPSIILYNDTLYLFLTETGSNILRLFYSDKLIKDWIEHPDSPIVVDDKGKARSAGKIITFENRLYRFSQDCTNIYGESVRAHKIIKLNNIEYFEEEYSKNPILQPTGKGWNSHRMHHLHAIEEASGNWIAAVDGLERKRGFFIN